jgi:hypothetical protein
MKRIFQSFAILIICFLLLPLYPTKAELKPQLATSTGVLDFKRCTKEMIPTLAFSVTTMTKEEILYTFKPSTLWIHLSTYSIKAKEPFVKVEIDPTSLQSGRYKETIEVETTYGNLVIQVWLELVEKRVKIKFVLDNLIMELQDIPQKPLEAAPFVMAGRSMLPLRRICEAIGAKIEWEPRPFYEGDTYRGGGYIRISIPPQEIEIQTYNKCIFVNNHLYQDVFPFTIRNGRTFITWDFLVTAFGVSVYYFSEERAYLIEY